MAISNILRKTKTINTEVGAFEIKHYTLGFREWLALRMFEVSSTGEGVPKVKSRKMSFDESVELLVATLVAGLASWPIKLETGEVAPINEVYAREFAEAAPSIAEEVLEAIREFNSLDPPNGAG